MQWVERVTLKDLMPDAKSVFRLLFKELQIQEPAFNDTIILYRRDADQKRAEQEDEKKPIKDATPVLQQATHRFQAGWQAVTVS